ncbi:MBL fold metallo-hydrolase [Algoriphagus terrigena]|uniref:MBL fold metallo-hydrolase n=1 Tax=Algoriphagus terrigena TaxID=344884 RepID=UPI000414A0C5|nr:MBL fold metallo-hydrolase [Algoriphagus terrigena]
MDIQITHIDTACILLEINGFKILTDPTLDKAGGVYHHGFGTFSKKTSDPALQPVQLPKVDLVLLSHHQHKDNFDIRGKEFTATVSTVLSTKQAAKAVPGVSGLDDWESIAIRTPAVPGLKITATPAQHRPWWLPEYLSGKVIGFVIEFDSQKNGVIYISGDTVYFRGIDEVARRFQIDLAIMHVGSVQFRYLTGFGKYTMDSKDLIKSIRILKPRLAIPIHSCGWTHFKESESALKNALAEDLLISKKIRYLITGERTSLPTAKH